MLADLEQMDSLEQSATRTPRHRHDCLTYGATGPPAGERLASRMRYPRGLYIIVTLANGVDISEKDYIIQIIYIHNRENVLSR